MLIVEGVFILGQIMILVVMVSVWWHLQYGLANMVGSDLQ